MLHESSTASSQPRSTVKPAASSVRPRSPTKAGGCTSRFTTLRLLMARTDFLHSSSMQMTSKLNCRGNNRELGQDVSRRAVAESAASCGATLFGMSSHTANRPLPAASTRAPAQSKPAERRLTTDSEKDAACLHRKFYPRSPAVNPQS